MRRIIIAAILTVISAVGGVGTSFAVNDLPNFGEWMKTNEQQFRKPHRHDGPNMHMNQHMMDRNNQMMRQDGMGGPNNGQYMYQNCQNQMMRQDGMGRNNGQYMYQNGQMPQGGGQPNGNAPQQQNNQGTSQTTQN